MRNIWSSMRSRCNNPHNPDFKNYGARGIKISPRWLENYEAFCEDVGPRPSPKHTLDRYPNNDGHYEPGNVRWATRRQQANNRRLPRREPRGMTEQTLVRHSMGKPIDAWRKRQADGPSRADAFRRLTAAALKTSGFEPPPDSDAEPTKAKKPAKGEGKKR